MTSSVETICKYMSEYASRTGQTLAQHELEVKRWGVHDELLDIIAHQLETSNDELRELLLWRLMEERHRKAMHTNIMLGIVYESMKPLPLTTYQQSDSIERAVLQTEQVVLSKKVLSAEDDETLRSYGLHRVSPEGQKVFKRYATLQLIYQHQIRSKEWFDVKHIFVVADVAPLVAHVDDETFTLVADTLISEGTTPLSQIAHLADGSHSSLSSGAL